MIYDEIYKKYFQVIVNYSIRWVKNRFNAEEVASETFKLLWLEWDSLNFPNDSALSAWLYRVADYKILENKRSKHNQYIPLDDAAIQNMVDVRLSVDYKEIDNYQEEQKFLCYISDIRKRLEGEDLKLFDMIVISKSPYNQIAEELNTTVPAIKMRWLRLKTRLRQIVQDITGEEL